MSLRITQGMLNIQMQQNLSANFRRMDHIQNQLSTGRRINAPSDDPVGITYSLRYRSELVANEQYQQNVSTAISWLDFTDSNLDQAGSVLQRIRELAVKGASGTNPSDALDAIRAEVGQLREQLVEIANSSLNGKHIFNGQKTDLKPYPDSGTASSVDTDSYQLKFEVGYDIEIPVNLTGSDIFGASTDADNLFTVLDNLMSALASNDYTEVSSQLDGIDARMEKLLSGRSEIGARKNRVEFLQDRLMQLNTNLTTLQSKNEDADMAQLITDLKMNESVYQASLASGARIIQPTLVDFLR